MRLLILGALPSTEERTLLYERLVEILSTADSTINTPNDTAAFKGTDTQRRARAFELIQQAELIIAECSLPSIGLGIELQKATTIGKPVLVIASEGANISILVKTLPTLIGTLHYQHIDEIAEELQSAVSQYKDN